MYFKTELRDNHNGRSTYGAAFVLSGDGKTWLLIGHTKSYRTYPRAVRARSFADGLCRRYHKQHFAQLPYSLIHD